MSFLPSSFQSFPLGFTLEAAQGLDKEDSLAWFREKFCVPLGSDGHSEKIYLCGNSLGLMPKATEKLINEELTVWKRKGVDGHFEHDFGRPWVTIDEPCLEPMAKIVGAKADEIAIMGSLTSNLHLLMVSFYSPTPTRYKIMMESNAFPSDRFALESQIRFHGFDPKDALIIVSSSSDAGILKFKDVQRTLEEQGETISLIMIGGVNYYTGQVMEMPKITEIGHRFGANVIFDLAHAAGNIPMHLHEWNVDAAAWCTYKYLNSGPGSISGIFVHERHHSNSELKKFTGWWGADKKSRFEMTGNFKGLIGAAAYQLSNPCVLAAVSLLSSLSIFQAADMDQLFQKTRKLSGFMRIGLQTFIPQVKIITPLHESGCQLSLLFDNIDLDQTFEKLSQQGVVCDKRKPNVIRIAPTPLYNSFKDIYSFVMILKDILK